MNSNLYKNDFAIITPYYNEEMHIIERSIASVKKLIKCGLNIKHYLISDGNPKKIADPDIIHFKLPFNNSDYGDTPRIIGATLAIRNGCYGLMFLDADNVIYPSHLLNAYNSHINFDSNIVIAKRDMLSVSGDKLKYPKGDNTLEHVDTGCFVFFKEAIFDALEWVKIPKEFSEVGDRYFWMMMKARNKPFTQLDISTVGYTTLWRQDYIQSNILPPENSKDLDLTVYKNFLNSLSGEERSLLTKRFRG